MVKEVNQGLVHRFTKNSSGNKRIDETDSGDDVFIDASTEKHVFGKDGNGYRLLKINEVPEHLRINPYILSGYRGHLNTKLCLDSIFWWTNETMNIWTHIFALMIFFGYTLRDYFLMKDLMPFFHMICAIVPQILFQASMIFSILYHTFVCRSEEDHVFFLALDMFGILISMMSGFLIGIYYGFICLKEWQYFYFCTASVIILIMTVLHNPWFPFGPFPKMAAFFMWFLYSTVPSVHWFHLSGGYENTLVREVIPRLLQLYAIGSTAMGVYITKLPERLFPGLFDYVGSSHQLWHVMVFIGYFHVRISATMFLEYAMNNGCPNLY